MIRNINIRRILQRLLLIQHIEDADRSILCLSRSRRINELLFRNRVHAEESGEFAKCNVFLGEELG